jgi:hypothetical protein
MGYAHYRQLRATRMQHERGALFAVCPTVFQREPQRQSHRSRRSMPAQSWAAQTIVLRLLADRKLVSFDGHIGETVNLVRKQPRRITE